VKEKQAMQTFKERLRERVLGLSSEEADLATRLDRSMALAIDLLKAEGGDPKVVFAALLLQKVDPAQAREILAELETEPEIIESVLKVLQPEAGPPDINRKIYQDVLALVETEAGAVANLHTRTAQQLAEKQQPWA